MFKTAACMLVLAHLGWCAVPQVCCVLNGKQHATWGAILPDVSLPVEPTCEWHENLPGLVRSAGGSRVIVAYHFACSSKLLNLGPAGNYPVHTYDVLFSLDASEGTAIKQVGWEDLSLQRVSGFDQDLLEAEGDHVLLRIGATLKLLSADLTELQERTLPTNGVRDETWNVMTSASGRNVLAIHRQNDEPNAQVTWLSSNGLVMNSTYATRACDWNVSITDDEIVCDFASLEDHRNGGGLIYRRAVRQSDGSPICSSCKGGVLQVSRNRVLLMTPPRERTVKFISPEGSLLLSYDYGKGGDYLEQTIVARDADVAAIMSGHMSAGLFPIVSNATYVVALFNNARPSISKKIRFVTRSAKIKDGDEVYKPKIALSPDGKSLYVLSGRRIYRLDTSRTSERE